MRFLLPNVEAELNFSLKVTLEPIGNYFPTPNDARPAGGALVVPAASAACGPTKGGIRLFLGTFS
jgi:hypothetical protein